MILDAFHLPALPDAPATVRALPGSEVALRIPSLTPDLLRRQVDALVAARGEHLRGRPVASVVRGVDRVAGRLLDPADPLRMAALAALPAATGYSPAMTAAVLDRMAADWRAERLHRLLAAELGDAEVLDGFRPAPSGDGLRRAYGPRLAFHVFSGNVPGVAVTSLVRSLLVKSATLGKAASGEPLLAALFARALAEEDPALGACLAVAYWPGGDAALEAVALESADAVVAYGGGEAVASLRARTPAATRFVAYGPRLSFGVAAREALSSPDAAEETARAAAEDASFFDQQGCVSPHLLYAEEGGAVSPRDFAARLAEAMAAVETRLPRGVLSAGEATAVHQLRAAAEFGAGEVFASPGGTAWTVVFDPDPAFEPSCLNRVLRVKPVPSVDDVPALVAGHAAHLQSVGVAGDPSTRLRLAEALGSLGASRIARLGEMAFPPPWWHHDGQPPLGALLRWTDAAP